MVNTPLLHPDQPGSFGVEDSRSNITPYHQQHTPFYRRRDGIITGIIILIIIVIGAIVGGAVGGSLTAQRARDLSVLAASNTTVTATTSTTASTTVTTSTTTSTTVTTSTTATTTVTPSTTATTTVITPSTTATGTTTVTQSTTVTVSAPSPSPSNCVWEGTAPFCGGTCHTGFTQMKTDNCGDGQCCFTGYKAYCCQL